MTDKFRAHSMRILILLLLSGCAHTNINTNTYMTDNLKVSYKASEYTRGLDVFKIGMKVAWALNDVSECTGINPGNYLMVIKYTDDIHQNYPGNDGITLSRQGLSFVYSEIKTVDPLINMRITRHEIIHFLLFTQGDPDAGHTSRFWDLCS
ncbi:MAG: hypothetical protein GY941_12825 [Planctomycetes bacterium]|nr:hypothetical protein [Planctomycetota bacterium]